MKKLFRKELLAGLLMAASCTPQHAEKPAIAPVTTSASTSTVTATREMLASIQLGKIEHRIIGGGIKVNGVLDVPPQNLVSVSAPLGGFVKNTDLLQGMSVKKGSLLVTLEGPEFIALQQDYLTNKSQLEFSQQEYVRQQALATENVNSAKTLQLAKANFLGVKAKVEGSAAMLRMININPEELEKGTIRESVEVRSPISGFITQVNINIGMHVNPTDVMIRIIDTDHLHAEAQVFEKDVPALRVGQNVRISLSDNSPARRATVYLIGREITADRMVRVHCHLEKEDPTLIPGMYFSAVIEISDRKVTCLPDNAIVTFEGKKYVFVPVAVPEFAMVEIKTGGSESGFTEILPSENLDVANAQIVVQGSYELLASLKNNEQ